jgi:hypothetical protein
VAFKASRTDHYLAIAEFYGRMLVEDLKNPQIPEFVLVHAARRTAHFALTAIRLAERRAGRPAPNSFPPWNRAEAGLFRRPVFLDGVPRGAQ